MPRFSGSAYDKAPLLIQIRATTSGSGSVGVVFAAQAAGTSTTGSASRPVLYRPSTPGTVEEQSALQTAEVRGGSAGDVSRCALSTTVFSVNPSVPSLPTTISALPIRTSWMTNPKHGIVFMNGGAVILYATASGGYTWNGALSWEEP